MAKSFMERNARSISRAKVVKVDESEWCVCENAHEPIITQELWDEVQSRLGNRKRETKDKRTENIFRGLLKCADCGGTMRIACPSKRKPYFVCVNSKLRKGGVDRCTTHNIQLEDLTAAVLRDIRDVFAECMQDEKAFREKVFAQLNENIPDANAIKVEIESLEKQILKEKEKYKRIYNDYYDGVIKSAEMFEEMSSECNDRIERFSEKKAKLSEELSKSEIKADDVGKFIALIKRFSNVEELTPEILNTLVSAIEVGEKVYDTPNHTTQNVSVNYKFISQLC